MISQGVIWRCVGLSIVYCPSEGGGADAEGESFLCEHVRLWYSEQVENFDLD